MGRTFVINRFVVLLSVCLATAVAFSAARADFEAGLRAYDAGDYAAALSEWAPLAEQGDLESQFGMGIIYENGRGAAQDYSEAAKWYSSAAEGGHPGAQFNLGNIYQQGLGVPKDPSRAVYWWTLSAAQGLSDAQLNLGIAYHRGDGVARDQDQAFSWFEKAAEGGNPMGQFSAGYAYETGLGTTKDLNAARRLYQQAAEAGIQQAVTRLAALGPAEEEASVTIDETVEVESEDPIELAVSETVTSEPVAEEVVIPEPEAVETTTAIVEETATETVTETTESAAVDYSTLETTQTQTATTNQGGPYIQLAAYLTESRAENAWKDLSGRHPNLLGGLPHRVLMVDLGGETGTVYRLQAGPMPAASEAQAICNELKAQSTDCFLVNP